MYTVPTDSDSESDCEEYKIYSPKRMSISLEQENKLIKLGCAYDPLEEYKRSDLYKNPKLYDQQFALKMQQHQLKLNNEINQMLKQQRQKQKEELDKIKIMLSDINLSSSKDDTDEDKSFEEELTKQHKLVDDFIALDKKKSQDASAEAKAQADAKVEKERKEQEEKARKEQQVKEQKEKKAQQLETQKIAESSAVSPQGLEEYKKYYEKIEFYQTNIRPKLQDDAFRKQCYQGKLLIRKTVLQLKWDHQTIMEKYTSFYGHLLKIKQQSPDGFEYMLNQLAKYILDQTKRDVHAAQFAAYFLARFAYLICCAIPDFLPYLMGRLLKRCPYLIPQYHDDDPTLSQEEIKSRLRYIMENKEKKTFQSFVEHALTQKCYVLFYGALCQTLPDPGQPENPFPIKHAWIWLTRICNMPLREITPFLVVGLLEVSTIRLLQAYPNQTPKVFRLLRETMCPLYRSSFGDQNTSGVSSLEIFLDDYFQTGNLRCVSEEPPLSLD